MVQSNSTFAEKIAEYSLTREDFALLAEFDAILNQVTMLSMEHQKDTSGWIAMSWFNIQIAKKKLFGGNATYRPVDITKMWDPKMTKNELPRMELKFHQLHDTAKTLVERLEKEFDAYFPEPDGDQMVAILIHPVTCRCALLYVFV